MPFFFAKLIHYTRQETPAEKNRIACSVCISGQSVQYSKEQQEVYAKNVQYNRSFTIEEGLTSASPKPQHV